MGLFEDLWFDRLSFEYFYERQKVFFYEADDFIHKFLTWKVQFWCEAILAWRNFMQKTEEKVVYDEFNKIRAFFGRHLLKLRENWKNIFKKKKIPRLRIWKFENSPPVNLLEIFSLNFEWNKNTEASWRFQSDKKFSTQNLREKISSKAKADN